MSIEAHNLTEKGNYKLIEETNNIVDLDNARNNRERLSLITGGPTGIDENWLSTLKVGTVFTCKDKYAPKEKRFLDVYCVLEHKDRVTNLAQKVPTGQQVDLWYDSLEFSRSNSYVATIAEVSLTFDPQRFAEELAQEEKEQLESTDGSSDRSV